MFFMYSLIVAYSVFSSCHAFNKLTVLTQDPNNSGGWFGHTGVNGSIIRGLNLLQVNYNFNPSAIEDFGDVVYVPANIDALRCAINLKKQGLIKFLIAGPNHVVRPAEFDHIVEHPAIDRYIVPCSWCQTYWLDDAPSLARRLVIWPVGVDTSYWKPHQDPVASRGVIIYQKTHDDELYTTVERLVKKYGFVPLRIEYGSYAQVDYKTALSHARFAIFLSRSESQGIALAECWSMNIPTLVWDPQEPHVLQGKQVWPISSAPYLTPQTGVFWQNHFELEKLLQRIELELRKTAPRAWVLDHMNDEICVQKLLDIIAEMERSR